MNKSSFSSIKENIMWVPDNLINKNLSEEMNKQIVELRRWELIVWFLLAFMIFGAIWSQIGAQGNLKLHYSFTNLSVDSLTVLDESGHGYNATLLNGAKVKKIGSISVLDLGATNGYLSMASTLGQEIDSLQDFTISTYLYIDPTTSVTDAGNFIWAFGNSNNMATDKNGGMFLTAKSTRFAISLTHWTGEQSVNYNSAFTKGTWKHVTYVQNGNTGTLYLDGFAIKSSTIAIKPGDLGATSFNYIGRSLYSGDAYLKKSLLTDFRLYNKALSTGEITSLCSQLNSLNNALTTSQLAEATQSLVLSGIDQVTSDIPLPFTAINGISISWSSTNTAVISNQGIVTRPPLGSDTATVTLTATLSKNGQTQTKIFTVKVLPIYDDQMSVARDTAALALKGYLNNLRTDLYLPVIGIEGSTITWQTNNPEFLSNTGKFLKSGPVGGGKIPVTLTATVSKGTISVQKVFQILIAEDEGHTAYLFAYFTGNDISQESIRFALSNDGYIYRALNNNNPIIPSASISSTGGVRDPHIYRGPDGNFYMVVTDMVSANGWNSNRAMVLLKSSDLINWQSSIVNIQTKYGYADLLRVWAPQTIYDPQAGKFMIYFSMKRGTGPDIIYYAYVNSSFTDIEAEPQQLYYSPTNSSCIDGDIIFMNGKYHLFHKTEGSGNGIKKAVSDNLTSGYVLYDKYLQQTTEAVEGSCVFKLINSDEYILMYDMYTSGKYQFTKSTDLVNFKIVDNEVSMNFTPRHGTVIPITAAEAKALAEKWGTTSELIIHSADGAAIKKRNIVIDNTNATVYLPLRRGTDLKAVNPELKSLPGATISPMGNIDFSQGPVTFTIDLNGVGSRNISVSAHIDNNPVLEGYYADPEILYSENTKKFYLYPTSDGFVNWSGTYFKVFSSDNLVDWIDEGVILNLPTDVSWATTNAWAPTIIERKINGVYKYFYYFCAAQKIGVAVADSPLGPFVDSGNALISSLPAGVSGGQQIDPDVFYDSQSGKYYLYWGNSYMAVAELNDNMISINSSTTKILTPPTTYREGTEVFYRNGKYYFMWSENDTRSEDYRVRYGTSTSPTTSLTIPSSNMVIAKDAANGIYGPGHNCVIQIPGKDEWYIIYHRFTRPKGITMGSAAGYFREVCIDTMKFNSDGSIIPVKPTLDGIAPIQTTPVGNKNKINKGKGRVFPNPAKNKLNVFYTYPTNSKGTISVYNRIGQKMVQYAVKSDITEIDISSLSSDMYFLSYSLHNKVIWTDKFLVSSQCGI